MVSPLLGALRGAQSAVPSNPKIGVIDTNALAATPAGKRAGEAFEKTLKQKQADLDKRTAEFQKSKADLEKQRPVLKPEIAKQKDEELAKRTIEIQQTYVKLERELAVDRSKMIEELEKQAKPQIEKIAKAEGVTMIIDAAIVVWADPTVDLTGKLLAEMK
jgi:outer membrane protein